MSPSGSAPHKLRQLMQYRFEGHLFTGRKHDGTYNLLCPVILKIIEVGP